MELAAVVRSGIMSERLASGKITMRLSPTRLQPEPSWLRYLFLGAFQSSSRDEIREYLKNFLRRRCCRGGLTSDISTLRHFILSLAHI
jgi:hypothetical protein